ncbi:MAG: SIS domain-containing protein, partial [Bacteriovoracaceae bacterium]|nr:SIS domain-containing protein [Bacteriovoracaceae bacterium]
MNKAQESRNVILKETADTFLAIAHEFKLGKLPTESPNPLTENLSNLAKENLSEGYRVFQNIDAATLVKMSCESEKLFHLKEAIADTLKSGGRIYLSGCGATGRLSLSLETFWREYFASNLALKEKVVSFMAGGDVALIHSIEKFEDFPEFGERQLRENHFHENDLLISCTEGGETPFVIGATNFAAKYAKRKPYFLYCNPDEILNTVATRSKEVLADENIHKINLTVGPMALTGSTRLQASTILMGFVGFALLYHQESNEAILKKIDQLINFHQQFSYQVFSPFTQ